MNKYIKNLVESFLNEISMNAVNKASNKHNAITKLLLEPNGKNSSNIEDNYQINSDNFEKYLGSLNNEAQKKRLLKLYQSGQLVGLLLRRQHVFGTIANGNLAWFSEHNISISPEFYESEGKAWTANYKNTSRKPTEDEHKFYRYFQSAGTDTIGMTLEEVDRYHKIFRQFFLDTTGIDTDLL